MIPGDFFYQGHTFGGGGEGVFLSVAGIAVPEIFPGEVATRGNGEPQFPEPPGGGLARTAAP